jgi:hypothetical protein
MNTKCPVCEQIVNDHLVTCSVLEVGICSDCDYLIELGFANYETQPPSYLYPATWVYDRIMAMKNIDFKTAKDAWKNESL